MTDSSQSSSRPRLFVRAWQLRDADAGALKLFLNLLRGRMQAEWVSCEDGPVDLLVAPVAVAPPSGQEALCRPGLVRLSVAADAAEAAASPSPVLSRPLQFEDFAAFLRQIEPELVSTLESRRPAPAAAPTLSLETETETEPAPKLVATPSPALERAPAAAVETATESQAGARVAARPPLDLESGARVRLRRWPDPVQLQGRRGHQRLASQISATALERDDLLALSGLPAVEVDAFLEAMHRAELLEVLPPEPAGADRADAGVSATTEAAPEPVPGSLFGLIRRRLGIGNS